MSHLNCLSQCLPFWFLANWMPLAGVCVCCLPRYSTLPGCLVILNQASETTCARPGRVVHMRDASLWMEQDEEEFEAILKVTWKAECISHLRLPGGRTHVSSHSRLHQSHSSTRSPGHILIFALLPILTLHRPLLRLTPSTGPARTWSYFVRVHQLVGFYTMVLLKLRNLYVFGWYRLVGDLRGANVSRGKARDGDGKWEAVPWTKTKGPSSCLGSVYCDLFLFLSVSALLGKHSQRKTVTEMRISTAACTSIHSRQQGCLPAAKGNSGSLTDTNKSPRCRRT